MQIFRPSPLEGKQSSLFSAAALLLVAVCLFNTKVYADEAEEGGESAVITLTDRNFEAMTQASTGATTGDWFVMFYAPWCSHCTKLKPTWEEVAVALKGKTNVAKVDATKEQSLAKRFSIRGYPTLLLFNQGKTYEFKGGLRTVEVLKNFASYGWKNGAGVDVPKLPTATEKLVKDVKSTLVTIHMLYSKEPLAFFLLCLIGLLLGVVMTNVVRVLMEKDVSAQDVGAAVSAPEKRSSPKKHV